MRAQVKVTNISHANGAGFGLWIAERFIKPGEFVVMPADELPKNYHTLMNVLEFEFIETYTPPDPNTGMVQQLLEMQKTLMQQMSQMQQKLNEAPAPQVQYLQAAPTIAGETEAPKISLGVGAPHFIPDIEDVEADIQVASTSSRAVDKAALMEKLKRSKK